MFETQSGEIFYLDVFFGYERTEVVLGEECDNLGCEEISICKYVFCKRKIIERHCGVDGRKLFAHEGNFSVCLKYLSGFASDAINILVDLFETSIFVYERFRFLWSEPRDSWDIIGCISANGEVIDDVLRVDRELLSCLGFVVDLVLHGVVYCDIAIDKLIEILISGEYVDLVFFVFP